MNINQYDMLEKNGTLVIAYMLIEEKYDNIHYIDFFDTIIRNSNLGYHMIQKYEKLRDNNVNLIPRKIIKTSAKYWAKILNVLDDKGDVQHILIDKFIEHKYIKNQDISWEYLYHLCSEG